MGKNPYINDVEKEQGLFAVGTVTSAPDHLDNTAAHHAVVESTIFSEDKPCYVLPQAHGDAYIPPVGSRVVVHWSPVGPPIVLGPMYQEGDDVPNVTAGERVVSHPDSNAEVRFNSDGSINIDGDTDVVINDGSKKAITDVSVSTTKDTDGHVTSVSLSITRDSEVFL